MSDHGATVSSITSLVKSSWLHQFDIRDIARSPWDFKVLNERSRSAFIDPIGVTSTSWHYLSSPAPEEEHIQHTISPWKHGAHIQCSQPATCLVTWVKLPCPEAIREVWHPRLNLRSTSDKDSTRSSSKVSKDSNYLSWYSNKSYSSLREEAHQHLWLHQTGSRSGDLLKRMI